MAKKKTKTQRIGKGEEIVMQTTRTTKWKSLREIEDWADANAYKNYRKGQSLFLTIEDESGPVITKYTIRKKQPKKDR